MEYIEKQLGLPVNRYFWEKGNGLPYLYQDLYEFEKVWIGDVESIFLKPKEKLSSIQTLKKHIAKIQQLESLPVVFEVKDLSWHRQQAMRQENIPYILQERQVYLPFLGASLYKTRNKKETQQTTIEMLTPSAQLLFLKYIYYLLEHKSTVVASFYPGDYAKELQISNMTITRAVEQIKQLGLVETGKQGTKIYWQTALTGKELFRKARVYLDSPVQKVVYVQKEDISAWADCFLKAGESALAMLTLLNEPRKSIYAIDKKIVKQFSCQNEFIDEDRQIEVEIWKYNPCLLSNKTCVDVLSLILSLDISDERIEQMAEELLEIL